MDNTHKFTIPTNTIPQQEPLPLPLAIEFNLEANGLGTITRIIALD
jgi:hypothetical protein